MKKRHTALAAVTLVALSSCDSAEGVKESMTPSEGEPAISSVEEGKGEHPLAEEGSHEDTAAQRQGTAENADRSYQRYSGTNDRSKPVHMGVDTSVLDAAINPAVLDAVLAGGDSHSVDSRAVGENHDSSQGKSHGDLNTEGEEQNPQNP